MADVPRKIRVQFVERDGYRVELIAPLNGPDTPSPVTGLLEHIGPTAYHLAYEVDDVEGEIARLVGLGYRVIEEPSCVGRLGEKTPGFSSELTFLSNSFSHPARVHSVFPRTGSHAP